MANEPMTKNQGDKLISLINDLIKIVNTNIGTTKLGNSDERLGASKNSDSSINKVIEKRLKDNSKLSDIKDKLKKSEEALLKLNASNLKLEDARTKALQKKHELRELENESVSSMSSKDKKLHEQKIKDLKKEITLEDKKYSAIKKNLSLTEKEKKIKDEYYKKNQEDIDKELKKEEKLAKNKEKYDKEESKADKLRLASASAMQSASMSIFSFGMKILNDVLDQESAMSKLSANYTLSKKESGLLKANLSDAAISTNLIGVDVGELVKMQSTYTDNLERSVMLSKEGLIALSNMGVATGIGAEGAAKMASEMEVFGLGAESTASFVQEMMARSRKSGLSASAITRKLQENLKIANSYTFKDGLKGVEDMTLTSAKFRVNMQSVASFADKISNPEGAIQAAASLQVLGGSFAQMADPMKLMNQGINDLNGLSDTYIKMLDGLGKVNKQTGEVVIGGYDRLRMKAAAEAIGVSLDEMMTTVRTKARRKAIETDFNLNPNITGDEETKSLIASLAQSKNGKFFVNIGGKEKLVTQLKKEDIEALQPEQNSLNIRTIAENTMGVKDVFLAGMASIKQTLMTNLLPLMNDLSVIIRNGFNFVINAISKIANNKKEIGNKGPILGGGITALGSLLMGGGAKLGLSNNAATSLFGKGLGALGKRLPLIGGLISAAGEYASSGSAGRAVGAGVGSWGGALGGAALGSLFGPIGTLIGGLVGGIGGQMVGTKFGGSFDTAHDIIVPSNGRPIKLDSKDDVLAAKPGGALAAAVTPSLNVKKTFAGVEKGYSGVYRSASSDVAGTVNLNIQGTINLVGGNNATKISASELVKDRQFVKELTRIIGNQLNRDKNGGKFTGGLNNNSF